MDAASDYTAAKAMLTRTLPAYVSYSVHAHAKVNAIVNDTTEQIVVRTSDGKVLKGNVGGVPGGFASNTGNEPVADPAFKAKCYEATGAQMRPFDGRTVEALHLHYMCPVTKGQKDFDTLYLDERTHVPIAATGVRDDEHVTVRVEQRFGSSSGHVLPTTLYVRVKGSGPMFWLDIDVDERYSGYRFSDRAP